MSESKDMKGGKDTCKFCEMLFKQLKNKEGPFKKIEDKRYELVLKHFKIKEGVGFCRGFSLCSDHMQTVKRDNKYRLNKGVEVPTDLTLLRKVYPGDR